MICCVVPAYKANATVCTVVRNALEYVDMVVVVDDGCPLASGAAVEKAFGGNPRVVVITRERNGGVGAAMKTGIVKCLELGASVVIKIDADNQMDASCIPAMAAVIREHPAVSYVKGNRFFGSTLLTKMPKLRLLGNASLSLLVKFATGYWNLVDPTNGFVAFNAAIFDIVSVDDFADSYFFEISVLGELGLKRMPIAELEMETIYGEERSSLAIRRVLWEFPPRLGAMFFKRILLQYFLFDINLGSLYLFFGALMTLAGAGFGIYEYVQTSLTGVARTPGTVMLAVLPILIGAQLLMNTLMYDVQFAPKTLREFGMQRLERDDDRAVVAKRAIR